MSPIEQSPQSFYHVIANNVQKGATYAIKFKNDPVVYTGVPALDMAGDDNRFSFQILEPKAKQAVVNRDINAIELMNEA